MGQARFNPVASAARRGEIKPAKERKPIKLLDWSKLFEFFMPAPKPQQPRQPRSLFPQRIVKVGRSKDERRRSRRHLRGMFLRTQRMAHLYPPQSGKRRPEFSSKVPGQWSREAAA